MIENGAVYEVWLGSRGPRRGQPCRAWLAKVLDRHAPAVGRELMRPAWDPVAFRITATERDGSRVMRVAAVGWRARERLHALRPPMLAALHRALGEPVRDAIRDRPIWVATAPAPVPYRINHLVVSTKAKHRERLEDADRIEELVRNAVEDHAARAGIALPADWEDRIYGVEPVRDQGTFAVPIHGGRVAVGWREVRLRAALALHGWWQAGRLQSRGFGRIGRLHDG